MKRNTLWWLPSLVVVVVVVIVGALVVVIELVVVTVARKRRYPGSEGEWFTFDEDETNCLFNYGIVKYDEANLKTRPDLMKLLTAELMKPYAKLDYKVP